MSSRYRLRQFVSERLTAAVEEIIGEFEQTIDQYEEEIDRQRILLAFGLRPEIKLHRIELSKQHVFKMEDSEPVEIKEEQQLEVKQEKEASMLIPVCDTTFSENQIVDSSQEQAADSVLAPSVGVLQTIELPKQHDIKKEEPEPTDIKEEQQLEVKQEVEASVITPVCDRTLQSEDQIVDSCPDGTPPEEQAADSVSAPSVGVHEANGENQLLSDSPTVDVSKDLTGKNGDSGSKLQPRRGKNQTNSKKSFRVESCGKESELRYKILRNMATGDGLHPCSTCGKTFRNISKLKKHKRAHKDEDRDQTWTEPGDSESDDARPELKRRWKRYKGKKYFQCDTCGKKFQYRSRMLNHMRVHTAVKPFACDTCGKKFRHKCVLITHMRTHTGEKPYCCKECGKSFTCSYGLLVHSRKHTGEETYPCKTCKKTFLERSKLKRHMKIHTDEKTYSCKTCGRAFTHNHDLKIHMRTHTGEKPHVCKTCGKGFQWLSTMRYHMKVHMVMDE